MFTINVDVNGRHIARLEIQNKGPANEANPHFCTYEVRLDRAVGLPKIYTVDHDRRHGWAGLVRSALEGQVTPIIETVSLVSRILCPGCKKEVPAPRGVAVCSHCGRSYTMDPRVV